MPRAPASRGLSVKDWCSVPDSTSQRFRPRTRESFSMAAMVRATLHRFRALERLLKLPGRDSVPIPSPQRQDPVPAPRRDEFS